MSALASLKERIAECKRLTEALSVVHWDMETYMPPGGAESRAEQLAVLQRLAHTLFTSDEVGNLLEASLAETSDLPYDHDDAAHLRVIKRTYDREVKVPSDLVAEEAKTTALAHEEWKKARKQNDYKLFQPWLEKIVDIERKITEHRGYKETLYDGMLDVFEPGMTTAEVERIFTQFREGLVELVKQIRESGVEVDNSVMFRKYDVEKQKLVTNDVVGRIGFDFNHGRQDIAVHPFCTSFSSLDVRITTRFDENYLPGSVFASMHEAGHAMYEQGFPREFLGTMLADGASLGFHESQSRMWENQVGRSREFISYYLPELKKFFPESLSDVEVEQFYKAANKVQPSLIRVEADEVTYNLHIMLRFEIEKAMVAGTMNFSELPEIWNSKMEEYLGIRPDKDANGVLQDVHWSGGTIGYFPTYSLGNLIAAQLWEKAESEMPDLRRNIAQGEFQPLLGWLRRNVHAHGSKYLPSELVQKITGSPIDANVCLKYLRTKYSEIYNLD